MDEEKPKGPDPKITRWLKEIKLAEKAEAKWKESAEKAWAVYRSERGVGDKTDGRSTFNVLWSNVEIKRQAVYNTLPKPDIRRRHKDKDPLAKAVSELLERTVTYIMDCQDMDGAMIAAVNDYLIPGRANIRIKYVAPLKKDAEGNDLEEIEYEEIQFQHWQWDDFIRGPGKTWGQVTWDAYKHRLTKADIKKRWPDFAEKLTYDLSSEEGEDEKKDNEETADKRTLVYEIWDKEARKVFWLAKSYKDEFLEIVDDPLELREFWPQPKPLYAIEDSASLVPQTEYSKYEVLAEELEIVTTRMNRIASALRVRGIYDATLAEMSRIFEAGDNQFIACESASKLMKEGGLEAAIWFLPLETLVKVYQILAQRRVELIGQIYEITGIADIVRGATNPNETLGAQEIKANFASMRLEKQKQAVQKFARGLIRIVVEIIAENFSRETLSLMSGLSFPTQAEQDVAKQRLQMIQQEIQVAGANPQAAQQMQQQAQQQVQQLQQVLKQPNWESIEQVMKNDLLREYRIDIETDSTIAIDDQRAQESMTEFANAMTGLNRSLGEMTQTGALTPPAVARIMLSMARKFKLGRDVEDEMESSIENPPPPKPDPEAQKAQAEMQMQQQKHQMDMQGKQMDLDIQKQKAEVERQTLAAKHQLEMQKMQAEIQKMQAELQIERERLMLEQQKLGIEARKTQIDAEAAEHQAEVKAREAETAAQSQANKNQYEQASHKRKMETLESVQE